MNFQVISLRVRSSFRSDLPDSCMPMHPCDLSHPDLAPGTDGRREMDYCSMLNRSLPEDIRIIGWTEVTPLFSARSGCPILISGNKFYNFTKI